MRRCELSKNLSCNYVCLVICIETSHSPYLQFELNPFACFIEMIRANVNQDIKVNSSFYIKV